MNLAALALRCGVSISLLLTSLWALLAYVPFTYQQVHRGGLVPALNVFGRIHPEIFWGVLFAVAVIFCLEPLPEGPRKRRSMRLRAGFWYLHVPLAIYFSIHPVFGAMDNAVSSYVWALAMLVPLVYLSAIAVVERWPEIRWGARPPYGEPRLFLAACGSAAFLSLVYGAMANWRAAQSWTALERLLATASSLATHLLIFGAFFVVLNLLTVIAGWLPNPQASLSLGIYGLAAWAVFSVMKSLVFPSISFTSSQATAYSAVFACTVAFFIAGISVLLRGCDAPVENGLDLAFGVRAASNQAARQWWRDAGAAILLAAAAILLAVASSKNDWNHLFQKLTALSIWVATFRQFYVIMRRRAARTPVRTGRLLALTFLFLPMDRALDAAERSLWARSGAQQPLSRFLDSYSGFDPSFKLLHDSMETVVVDSGFYQFLARNTNLSRSTRVEPAEIELAAHAEPLTETPPHIFIIVVDSLRKDYLSPYNSRVDFTPNVQAFAADSVVMRNAFTRYGGTGLSEPSIWVGGAMIHKQYVTPFAPMNSLQKLLEAHDYQAFVTRDSILETVVTPWPKMRELDANQGTMNLDLCQSLDELTSDLGAAQNGPVFAYTQPQNIHISVISRQGQKALDDANYHGLYAPYASRLRRMDGCFGNFVTALKSRGLYDNSFIAITADHGDSLGEQGRWGHAYTIFPEIVRVPLIIHLPRQWKEKYRANPDDLAFNSDLTPSLYYMLGHRPIVNDEVFGKPLFAEKMEELNAYKRDSYLVASSYAAVYGILSEGGRFLYTSDAVNLKDSWFDLAESEPLARSVTSTMRSMYEKLIREKIGRISSLYKFTPL